MGDAIVIEAYVLPIVLHMERPDPIVIDGYSMPVVLAIE